MSDYAGFGDPSSQKNALLVECGQHWEQASRKVAIETMFRFLKATHLADDALLAAHGIAGAPPAQKFVTVTDAVTIERSEEHTSELQSLMRISYAVFCLQKKKKQKPTKDNHINTQS